MTVSKSFAQEHACASEQLAPVALGVRDERVGHVGCAIHAAELQQVAAVAWVAAVLAAAAALVIAALLVGVHVRCAIHPALAQQQALCGSKGRAQEPRHPHYDSTEAELRATARQGSRIAQAQHMVLIATVSNDYP